MLQKLWSTKFLVKIRKFFLNLLTFVFVFSILYFCDSIFTINKINLNLNNSSKILNISGLEELKQKNILLINLKEVEKALVARNPQVKKIAIKKKYPSQIEIDILVYEAYAQIEVSNGFFILSEDGRILEKVKQINSNHKNTVFLLASSYYSLRQYQKASENFKILYEKERSNFCAYNYGQTLLNLNKFEQALSLFEQCKNDQNLPFSTLHIAKCLASIGQKDNAKKELQNLLKNSSFENIKQDAQNLLNELI